VAENTLDTFTGIVISEKHKSYSERNPSPDLYIAASGQLNRTTVWATHS